MTPREARFVAALLDGGMIAPRQVEQLDRARRGEGAEEGQQRPLWRLAVDEGLVTADQAREVLRRIEHETRVGTPDRSGGEDTRHLAPMVIEAAGKACTARRLGNYELLAKLGQGAMGAVYKARQESMGRDVAIKVLPRSLAGNKEFIHRFLQEARAAGRLSHPNIVTGFDAGFDDGYYYLAMEYVDGRGLGEVVADGPLEEAEVLRLGIQVADALEHAHAAGIIHRDVKPDNILLSSGGQAKLCDLGLARCQDDNIRMTQANMAVGTACYISPEQARGEAPSPASDIYSLGCTLYHLIAGRPPFEGENSLQVMHKHINETPPPPGEVNPGCAGRALETVIMKMMARDPSERYAGMAEVRADLEKVAGGGIPSSLTGAVARRRSAGRQDTGAALPVKRRSRTTGTRPTEPVGPRRRSAAEREPATGRRTGLIVVAAVLALAALGGGAVLLLPPGDGSGSSRNAPGNPGDSGTPPPPATSNGSNGGGERTAPVPPSGGWAESEVVLRNGLPVAATGTKAYSGTTLKHTLRSNNLVIDSGNSRQVPCSTERHPLIRFAVTRGEGGPLPDDVEILEARLEIFKVSSYVPCFEMHRMKADWREKDSRIAPADVEERVAAVCDLHAAGRRDSRTFKRIWKGPWPCTFDVTRSLRAALRVKGNHGWIIRVYADAKRRPFVKRVVRFAGCTWTQAELRPRLRLRVRMPRRSATGR